MRHQDEHCWRCCVNRHGWHRCPLYRRAALAKWEASK